MMRTQELMDFPLLFVTGEMLATLSNKVCILQAKNTSFEGKVITWILADRTYVETPQHRYPCRGRLRFHAQTVAHGSEYAARNLAQPSLTYWPTETSLPVKTLNDKAGKFKAQSRKILVFDINLYLFFSFKETL